MQVDRLFFVVLELLMFKVCGIISISKIEFFNFFGNKSVKFFLGYLSEKLIYWFHQHYMMILHEQKTFKSIRGR